MWICIPDPWNLCTMNSRLPLWTLLCFFLFLILCLFDPMTSWSLSLVIFFFFSWNFFASAFLWTRKMDAVFREERRRKTTVSDGELPPVSRRIETSGSRQNHAGQFRSWTWSWQRRTTTWFRMGLEKFEGLFCSRLPVLLCVTSVELQLVGVNVVARSAEWCSRAEKW